MFKALKIQMKNSNDSFLVIICCLVLNILGTKKRGQITSSTPSKVLGITYLS